MVYVQGKAKPSPSILSKRLGRISSHVIMTLDSATTGEIVFLENFSIHLIAEILLSLLLEHETGNFHRQVSCLTSEGEFLHMGLCYCSLPLQGKLSSRRISLYSFLSPLRIQFFLGDHNQQ